MASANDDEVNELENALKTLYLVPLPDYEESFEWLKNDDKNSLENLSIGQLASWMVVTEKKKIILNDENQFCQQDLLNDYLESKLPLDNCTETRLCKVRKRANPFELIGRLFFVNRSAVKFANLDALINFRNPMDQNNESLVNEDELFYFGDIGGGPGGFVDYLLWRKGWQAKGFGITLRRGEGTKYTFHRFSSIFETFDSFSGKFATGDYRDPATIKSFVDYVLDKVPNRLHLVVADGAIDVVSPEQKKQKECLSKQLHLSNCVMALSLLRDNGMFITKLFDTITPFTVGLIYFMYLAFEQICIIKPVSARPHNPERYLVCRWKKPNTKSLLSHLTELNKALVKMEKSNSTDITQLVSFDVLSQDKKFFEFMYDFNNTFMIKQIYYIKRFIKFLDNPDLCDPRYDLKEKYMKIWNLPESIENPLDSTISELLTNLIGSFNQTSFYELAEQNIWQKNDLTKIFKNPDDWYYLRLSECKLNDFSKRTFFFSQGSNNVFMYSKDYSNWIAVDDKYNLVLPSKTLVYAELVTEYLYRNNDEIAIPSFNIIDGMFLAGTDITFMSLIDRNKMCRKFQTATHNPFTMVPNKMGNWIKRCDIRCKELKMFKTFYMEMAEARKKRKNTNNEGQSNLVTIFKGSREPLKFVKFNGVLFLRNETEKGKSNFSLTYKQRTLWSWQIDTYKVLNNPHQGQNLPIYLSHFFDFINHRKNK